MSDSVFRFRQFTVHQEKCAMKVGTDAVLLGSWIRPGKSQLVLDIGTGTGLIALMIAQKTEAEIHCIDIDENACIQARENFLISPWFPRLHCTHASFQEYSLSGQMSYDLIVTNPPYFHHASKPSLASRIHARHHDALTFDDLIDGVKRLLKPDGRFCLILPSKEGMEFLDKAMMKGLYCHELVRVKTKSDKSAKRVMMEFDFRFGILNENEIVIQEQDGSFTNDFIALTKEYYLQLRQAPTVVP